MVVLAVLFVFVMILVVAKTSLLFLDEFFATVETTILPMLVVFEVTVVFVFAAEVTMPVLVFLVVVTFEVVPTTVLVLLVFILKFVLLGIRDARDAMRLRLLVVVALVER